MKRLISIIVLLSLSFAAFANVVSEQAARATGEKFLSKTGLTKVWDGTFGTKASESDVPFYAFNAPGGGWVIVSAEDALSPVIGYSFDGSFKTEGMPDHIAWWFSRFSNDVALARAQKKVASAEVKALWASPRIETKGTGGKTLNTAKWGQETPYNNDCPTYRNTSKCVTGCVATAMAIVMRQNQWPAKGKGTLDSYTTDTKKIKVEGYSIDDHSYDWSNMPLTAGGSSTANWTSTQKAQVAQLMHDCGVMVKMDYDPEGSGAMSSEIIPALHSHMYYSGAAREQYRYQFSSSDWLSMLKAEIDADRAVLYGGSDSSSEDGHQFVLDGYDAQGNVHINWGWEGDLNGYYPICYIGDKKSNGVNDVFNYYDSAIFGLVADEKGVNDETGVLSISGNDGKYGISLASGTIGKGSSFSINVEYIWCESYTAYNGAVKAGLVDKYGKLKEYISSEKALKLDGVTDQGELDGDEIKGLQCKITKDIELGDAIEMFYSLTDGSWVKMGFETMDADYIALGSFGVFDAPMIRIPEGGVSANAPFYFDLVYGQKLVKSSKWYVDNASNTKGYASLSSGTHTIKAVLTFTDKTTETIVATIQVN